MRSTSILAAALALALPGAGRAADEPAVFALVIGVNNSVDRDLPRLRYADDDAARYFELFRLLGARSYLLARFDESTRRVHVQAAAEAQPPRRADLQRAVKSLKADVARARARGVRTVLYVAYAGHGKAAEGEGYVSLEDARLTGGAIARQVLGPVGADTTHLIVDACNSYLLALGRGPGGRRRAARGFSRLAGTLMGPGVGLVLSTSSARDSHEWEGVQAGVFSHAVRSGLYGAADADGDGQVSYREIGAFVEQASRAIPNERFRPRVFARPPEGQAVLVDLRPGLQRGLQIDEKHHGRYLLEDTRGVRLVDLHSGPTQVVRLLRPAGRRVYLRRLTDEQEYAVDPGEQSVQLAALSPAAPRAAMRGAAHHAFARLFELPFDRTVVQAYVLPDLPQAEAVVARKSGGGQRWRRIASWSTLAVAVAAVAAGGACTAAAVDLRNSAPESESHTDRVERNADIGRRNTAAISLYAVGGATAAASLVLFLWPGENPPVVGAVDATGVRLTLQGRF